MPLNFTYIPEIDFSMGIDQHSAEANVLPQFVEDALNVDIQEKRLAKRPGYQSFSGCIPIRVQSLEYDTSTNEILFTLDDSFDLSVILDAPIVVYGKTSITGSGGDFTATASGQYYSNISTDPRKELTGATTVLADSGFSHSNFLVGITESLSTTEYDNKTIEMDNISIDQASPYEVTLEHTIEAAQDPLSVFTYYYDASSSAGQVYVDTFNNGGPGYGSGTFSETITAGTHNLSNFQIGVYLHSDTGSAWRVVEVDTVTIDSSGNVDFTFTNNGPTITDLRVTLIAFPTANIKTGAFAASTSSQTLTISNVNDPFIFGALYLEDLGTGDKTLCKPDCVEYDAATDTYTITVTVGVSTNFEYYYDFGFTQTNIISVTPDTAITADAVDGTPQMTIWGICHDTEGVYGPNKVAREGWTTHIDSYKSRGENRVVCGLGGNLFDSRTRTELASDYLLPRLLTRARNRVSTDTLVGPAFRATGSSFARSRGYINFTGGSSNWATVTTIEYQTAGGFAGYVKYTLNCPSHAILDSTGTPTTIGSVISTTTALEDWLTVKQCGFARHNTTLKIKGAEVIDADNLAIYVENTTVDSVDFDETDVGGLAGIFTDQIPMSTTNYFIPDDELLADLFGDDSFYKVLSSTSTTSVIDNTILNLSIPVGLRLVGRRTSYTIPLRDTPNIGSVDNFVEGDTVSLQSYERLFDIKNINTNADISVSITGNGTLATATLGSGTTSFLSAGQYILLCYSEGYTGEHKITAITGTSTFTFASTETASVAGGILMGKYIEVNEDIQWNDATADNTYLTVARRWIPIEAPTDTYTATPAFYPRYFDFNGYTAQPFLRSVMVLDNMYLTNGDDVIHKYDGTSLYRAGLPRWQAGLFTAIKPDISGIEVPELSRGVSGVSNATFTVAAGDEEDFQSGDRITHDNDNARYTVTGINTTNNTITVDRNISGAAAGNILKASSIYTYYFRLNMVDLNNNIIASAAVGNQDFVVELSETSIVELKLVGLPTLGNYDYDRLEVEIYRTKANTSAPFFKLATLPLSYNANEGYLVYQDKFSDDTLFELDVVNSAILGSEIGTTWQEPLRAKYVTSGNNKLVLANLTDYPEASIVIDGPSAINTNLDGEIFQFERLVNAVAPTVTDNNDTQRYEFTTSSLASTVTFLSATSFKFSSATSLAVGDWVYIFYKGSAPSDLDLQPGGWWQVAADLGGSEYSVNASGLTSFTGTVPNRIALATDPTDIPVYLNDTTVADYDSNYQYKNAQPIGATDEKNVALNRLAAAINCVNRKCETTDFSPWLTALADGSYGQGQIIVRQPNIQEALFQFRAPSSPSYDVYFNGVRISGGTLNSSVEQRFPSRLIASYSNYAEIMDNPTASLEQNSDSVYDINSADGQEITGIIPFFGDSAFGAAQKTSMIVVFKQNSIYLVDLTQRGQGAVQKIESQGLGCTAPYSIAVTKDGIMFANEAGIYKLVRSDLSVQYVGQMLERKWLEEVDRDQLAIMQGHHFAVGKMYKLSVVVPGADTSLDIPNEVYCYHHSSERTVGAIGGWTRYDNHDAIGWANLDSDAYFANTGGKIYSIRQLGESSDFRDADQAITAQITSRALDFGAPGIRKLFAAILAHYRSNIDQSETQLTYAYDLREEFLTTDEMNVSRRENSDSLSDTINQKGRTIKSVLDRKRAVYFQVRFTNDGIDEPLDVAGFTIKVAGLSDKGILQAATTTEDS